MRPDKFTQKMQEALQAAQDVASQFSQQEISNEHFLITLKRALQLGQCARCS